MNSREEWRKRKKEFYSTYKRVCGCCGRGPNHSQIQLHHLSYEYPLGSEPDEILAPLCKECHAKVHLFATENSDFYNLAEATIIYIRMVEYGGNPLRVPRKLSQRKKGKGKTVRRRRRKKDPYSNYAKSSRSRKLRKQRNRVIAF